MRSERKSAESHASSLRVKSQWVSDLGGGVGGLVGVGRLERRGVDVDEDEVVATISSDTSVDFVLTSSSLRRC